MREKTDLLKQWMEWNGQGFIPGPDESPSAFEERIAFCLNLESHLGSNTEGSFPLDLSDAQSKENLKEALPLTQKLYGIRPEWVPIFFSNHHLAPWHGGCAWIFQLSDTTPTGAFLQLRASLKRSPSYLGIYRRKELTAHELAHVGRMQYQEPKYEEIFAYQSSSSRWRRFFGPIVQSSKESLFFILSLGLVILSDLALMSLGEKMAPIAWGIKLLPAALFLLALGRLSLRQRTYRRCQERLEKIFPCDAARHLLYRLKDSEIERFSRMSSLQICQFIDKASENSFRWRFLKALYPIP